MTTPHAAEIIGGNWPGTSESATVDHVIKAYRDAAASVGTADVSHTMAALMEANATGKTPDKLVAGFTDEQRKSFERSLAQLNQGQGASVMAQDILNTKVRINGTVTSFEAAVETLLAGATPQNQAEIQKKYNELLEQAKTQVQQAGSDHKSTQDSLVAGIEKGVTPEIPTTMSPTSSDPSKAVVPGMPDNALGSVLQQVGGQMMKPPSVPMPNLSSAVQPVSQAVQELAKGAGKGGSAGGSSSGVPVTNDALKKLTTTAGLTNQGASLSQEKVSSAAAGDKDAPGAGAGAGRPSAGGSEGRETRTNTAAAHEPTTKPGDEGAPGQDRTPSSSGPAATAMHESSTAATAPASTAAPEVSTPSTTLSSGGAAEGAPSLAEPSTRTSSAQALTHTSAGEGSAAGSSTLSGSSAAAAGPAAGGSAAMGGGAPMMPMGMGAAAGGVPQGASSKPAPQRDPSVRIPGFRPDLSSADTATITDFGADFKGLRHATDMQHIAAGYLAGIIRAHRRVGIETNVAVGLQGTTAVVCTSDGLGFYAPGVKVPPGSMPLVSMVPDDFIARWIGCDDPWRPLMEAADVGLIPMFDSVVSMGAGSAIRGALALTEDDIAQVNVQPGTSSRVRADSIEQSDVTAVIGFLQSIWGVPQESAASLYRKVAQARWSKTASPSQYAQLWVSYLLSAAAVDLQYGDLDSCRYMLRTAMRVPMAMAAPA